MKKITNIICIFLSAVVLFSCGDDNTNNEQGEGTIAAKIIASNAYPALEENVILKVNISVQTLNLLSGQWRGKRWEKSLN